MESQDVIKAQVKLGKVSLKAKVGLISSRKIVYSITYIKFKFVKVTLRFPRKQRQKDSFPKKGQDVIKACVTFADYI